MHQLRPRKQITQRPTPTLAEFRVKRPQYTEECPDCGEVVAALLAPDADPVLDMHRSDAKRIRCNLTAKAVEFGNLGVPFNGGVEGIEQHAPKCLGRNTREHQPVMPVPTVSDTPIPAPAPKPTPPPSPDASPAPQPEQPSQPPAQPADGGGGGG